MKKKLEAGRPTAIDPAVFRYTIRMTAKEHCEFLTLFEKSGLREKSAFIRARIFNESFKVIKVDKGAIDVFNQLRAFHAQFRAVGVNYNQLIKALQSVFTERKAYVMINKLHRETMKLVAIHEKVLHIAEEFKEKYDR